MFGESESSFSRLWSYRLTLIIALGLAASTALAVFALGSLVRNSLENRTKMRAENTTRDLRELAGLFDFDERIVLDRNLNVLLGESRTVSPLLLPRQYYSALPYNQKSVRPRLPPRNCYLALRLKTRAPVQDLGKRDYPDKFCSYFTDDVSLGKYLFFAMSFPDEAVIPHQPGDLTFNSDGILLRVAEKNGTSEWRIAFTVPKFSQQASVYEITSFKQTATKTIERDRRIEGWAFLTRQADGTQTVNVLGRIDYRAVDPHADLEGTWPPEGFRDIHISIGRRDSSDRNKRPDDLKFENMGLSELSLSGNSASIHKGHAQLDVMRASGKEELSTASLVHPPVEWEMAERAQDRVSILLGDWFLPNAPVYYRRAIPDTDLVLRATHKTQVLEKAVWQTGLALTVLLILISGLLIMGFTRYVRPLWMMSRMIRSQEGQSAVHVESRNVIAKPPAKIADRVVSIVDRFLSWLISQVVVPLFEDKKITPGVRFPYADQSDEIGVFARRCNALLDESDRQKKEITRAATALNEQAAETAREAASRAETLKLIRHEVKNDLQYLQQENLPSDRRVALVQRIKFVFAALEDAKSPEHFKAELASCDLEVYLRTIANDAGQGGLHIVLQIEQAPGRSFLSMVDTYLLEMAITNVLSNARHHGDPNLFAPIES